MSIQKRLTALSLAAAVTLTVAGCGGSNDKGSHQKAHTLDREGRSSAIALFNPSAQIIPFPSNLLFVGSEDGTLNAPGADANPAVAALNQLNGFSTVAPWRTRLSAPVDPATVIAGKSVRVFKLDPDPANPVAPQGFVRELTAVEFAATAVGDVIQITPLQPLAEGSLYLAVLTRDITTASGAPLAASVTYSALKADQKLDDPDAEQLRQLVRGELHILQQVAAAELIDPIAPTDVALSWSVRTQMVTPTLKKMAALAANAPTILLGPTGKPTPGGEASVYAGVIELPYYLGLPESLGSPGEPTVSAAPLTAHWRCADSNCELPATLPTALPDVTGMQRVPVLMTVPDDDVPAEGWRVVIFQHGLTGNRTNLLGIADSLAKAGFAAIAIDLPLHGLVLNQLAEDDPLRALHASVMSVNFGPHHERTLYLDANGDGKVDPSGSHFINLPSLLTARDNVRQGVADLLMLAAAVRDSTFNAEGYQPDIDPSQIHFLGHSLGGIVGTPFVALDESIGTTVIANSGGGIAKLLEHSQALGPTIKAGLTAMGLAEGSAAYEQFFVVAQTAIDAVDPVNYARGLSRRATAQTQRPVHMIDVVGNGGEQPSPADLVVPTDIATAPLSGSGALARIAGLEWVAATATGVPGEPLQTLTRFTGGHHSSLLRYEGESPADDPVFMEMQSQVAAFFGSNGLMLPVTSELVAPAPQP